MHKRRTHFFQKIYLFAFSYQFLIVLTFAFLLTFLVFIERYFKNQFNSKITDIAESMASNVLISEQEMDKTLNAVFRLVMTELKYKNLTRQELAKIVEDTGISAISLYKKDGKMYLTSRNVLEKDYKYSFYKDISITDVDQCETQMCGANLCRTKDYEILNCKIKRLIVRDVFKAPLTNHEMPMMYMFKMPIKVPAKWVHGFVPSKNTIIDVLYAEDNINKMLEKNVKIYKDLNYLSITDNRGVLIAEAGNLYDKDAMEVAIPFGKVWKFNLDGKETEYSYVLNAQFYKKELKDKILIMRILFGIISLLILLLIIILKTKIEEKQEAVSNLSNIIKKDKPAGGSKKTNHPFIN